VHYAGFTCAFNVFDYVLPGQLTPEELFGEVGPTIHTLVWPSTGNHGIGGAYVFEVFGNYHFDLGEMKNHVHPVW
jgi:hypothetical protein